DSNRGKGAALRAAFAHAAEHFPRSPVVTLDADGQHDPAFAPRLLAALDLADIVIGTREIGLPSVPPHRQLRIDCRDARGYTLASHRQPVRLSRIPPRGGCSDRSAGRPVRV